MFKNYFKISFRNLLRNKSYTFINITGLALSVACGIVIFTIVVFHLGFDDFHNSSNRIYRFVTEQHRESVSYSSGVPPAFGKAFRTDYTFAEQTANIINTKGDFIAVDNSNEIKKFKEDEGIAFAEPGYFDIFNYPLVSGNKTTVLAQPNTAIITERLAEKYFGTENPVNKIVKLNNAIPLTITGILKNLPGNTAEKAQIFISYPTLKTYNNWLVDDHSWGGITSELQCFTRLKPGVKAADVEKPIQAYVKKFRPTSSNKHVYKLQPLSQLHFDERYDGEIDKSTLWVLSFIGLFIIITACVNFINLATAQALKRSKEVGVRKVLGGMRSQLFWQFIIETAVISVAGIVLAIGLAQVVLPYANSLFKTEMIISPLHDSRLMLFLLVLAIVITFMAGSYPAIVLAGFKPVVALKGKISQQNIGGFNTRRGLIVTQFAISQLLIIGMIVIGSQMRYATHANLGFDKDAVVMIPIGNDTTGKALNTFKSLATSITGVNKMSVCYAPPASQQSWGTSVKYNHEAEDVPFSVSIKSADNNYLRTFGLELAAGRDLLPSDTVKEILVNETFIKRLNIHNVSDALGKNVSFNGGGLSGPIVGIIKDFHNQSFHGDITPVLVTTNADGYSSFAVKININNAKTVLPGLEKAWNRVYANQVYSYKFLDDSIADFYENEQTMLTLVQVFAFIAIFIGCLGLYGLVMFMAMQKTKEIGIRKVLGSTIRQILWIFGKEFGRLILIAFVIAAPVAWLLMNQWLEQFKFKISISPLFFAATVLLMFVIAGLTVGYQAVKAALLNPVKAIKAE